MEALGQQMNNNGNGGREAQDPITPATFLKVNPPKFKGTTNPTEADTWFQAMERALQAQLVPEEQRVEFATYLLTGKHRIGGKGLDVSCNRGMIISLGMLSRWNSIRSTFRIPPGQPRNWSYCS